jgi:hypothetical protein
VKLTAVIAGIGSPHAALALQITRLSRPLTDGRWPTEIVYAITDLTTEQTSALELADAVRAHWGIQIRVLPGVTQRANSLCGALTAWCTQRCTAR